MDFFGPQHSIFNQNQTLNRQRFPTINRRTHQAPLQDEWFRRGGGSLSPSQIRRHNLQQQQQQEQFAQPRGFTTERPPDSPGQSRRIPIMVADGQGGYRTLEKDRNLVESEKSPSSPSRTDRPQMFNRQSSYDRPQQMDTSQQFPQQQHLDRTISRDGSWPPQRMQQQQHPIQRQRGGLSGRLANGNHQEEETAMPSVGNKPKTFNIPIQIEGQGRECFVKDEPPSEDEGYSQDDCSSQTEDENRNITEPEETPVITQDEYKNVRNMPRFVSEVHFPTLRREAERKDANSSDIVNFINNENEADSKKSSQTESGKTPSSLDAADYPFPEVTVPTDGKDEKREADMLPGNSTSSSEKEGAAIPMPATAPPLSTEQEDSIPSSSEKESAKSSDSETDSQSTQQITPLEKIAKISSSIAELGADVERFEGQEKTKEYRRIEEYLMRALLSLDKIDTQGDATIRSERKKAVQSAQTYLSQLEEKLNK